MSLSKEQLWLEERYNEMRSEYDKVFANIDDKRTRVVIVKKFFKDLSKIKESLADRVKIGGNEDARLRRKVAQTQIDIGHF